MHKQEFWVNGMQVMVHPLHPSLPHPSLPNPIEALFFSFKEGERKIKEMGWKKKYSNIHNNQTTSADRLDNSIARACWAMARNLKNLATSSR